ncbi:hypothetical protein H5410_037478 [Solanum commersonii]|uniref:Uncharacterized protein n=1 Tax=Solanum commersonii TaxID=4109 RepID=A0A9J5YBB7_SOLCO|nr:hypothetical protein H5410_037478 [Solanum commersonii]
MDLAKEKIESPMVEYYRRMSAGGDQQGLGLEIEVETEGLIHTILVWVEASVTVTSDGRRSGEPLNYPLDNSTVPTFFYRDMRTDSWVKLIGHVGTSVDGGKTRSKAHRVPSNSEGPFKGSELGPNFKPNKSRHNNSEISNFAENEAQTIDPVTIEIQANILRERRTISHIQSSAITQVVSNTVMYEGEEEHAETQEDHFNICMTNKSIKIVHLKENLSLEEAGQVDQEESKALQLKEQDEAANCIKEDVIPLKMQLPIEEVVQYTNTSE